METGAAVKSACDYDQVSSKVKVSVLSCPPSVFRGGVGWWGERGIIFP